MQAPRLSDGIVVLRAHRPDDVDHVLEQCSDPEAQRWTTVPSPYTREHAVTWVASRPSSWAGSGERTLVVESQGRFAGQIGLRPTGARAAELGYGLSPWARGRGLMARSVRLLLRWAFDQLGLEVVHWLARVGNWPSRRVAWACGFTHEGQVRGLVEQRGQAQDAWVGSIRRGEPMQPRTPWLSLPELLCGGVRLRAHRTEDALRIAEACAAPSTQRWLPDLPHPYTLMHAAEYLTSREDQHATAAGLYWAVADTGDDRLLGGLGLMGLAGGVSRTGEIGYWAHPDARGRGTTTTAVRLVARHALVPLADGGLGLDRVLLRAAAGNTASRRVAEKAGFTQVGVDRRAERLRDGTVEDFIRYDLLADELTEIPLSGARLQPADL